MNYNALPTVNVEVNAAKVVKPFEWQRHCLGHGGINSHPLPDRVIAGAKKLRLPLLRTFMQEYLRVYPGHNTFNWDICDKYMQSLQATGANVVASLTIKPKALFPKIDHAIWQPASTAEWQKVIAAVVKRYSVDQKIVTYWEVGNETDIGEWGGCPVLTTTAQSYFDFYTTMLKPVLEAFPGAKVGGPAIADGRSEWLPGFIELCKKNGTQFDFLSWHLYNNSPSDHVMLIRHIKSLLTDFPGKRPELLITEWNKGFERVSVEEMAFDSNRAAHTAATILDMMAEGVDWTFYYHVWDQTAYIDEFDKFFNDPTIMTIHWNEIPHRFGLFGVNEEVRPQYFVYQLLGRMGDQQVSVKQESSNLRIRAVRDGKRLSVLLVNHQRDEEVNLVAKLSFTDLPQGRKMLRTYRIDNTRNWNSQTLELNPTEQREVDTYAQFKCHVYCPAGTVTMLALDPL